MEERPRSDVSDGYSWWCRQCKGWKSIREGSFSKSKLSLQKWLFVLVLWAKDTPVTDVIDDAEIDTRTGVDIYQWLAVLSKISVSQVCLKVFPCNFLH